MTCFSKIACFNRMTNVAYDSQMIEIKKVKLIEEFNN